MEGTKKSKKEINRLVLKGNFDSRGIVRFGYGTLYFRPGRALIKYQYEDHEGLISLQKDSSYIKIFDEDKEFSFLIELVELIIKEEYIEITYDSGELIQLHIDIDKEFEQ